MNLMKTINAAVIREDGGATGAGAIGGVSTPLFASMVKRSPPIADKPKLNRKLKKSLNLKEAMAGGQQDSSLSDQGPSTFDSSAVISQLKNLERHEEADNEDTVTFGLEDESGNLVRVVVKAEEAKEFEDTLRAFLAQRDDEDENVPEIAEVLFKLKDQFTFVDVVWPQIEEDEEQQVDVDAPDAEVDLAADTDLQSQDSTSQTADLLQQVIDMMKADAEARKAEARAREAEAKTKEADHIVHQSLSRVKQEEQFLDMETQQKAQKEQEREAKRLAQLARWKQEMADDHGIEDEPEVPELQPGKAREEEELGRSKLRPPANTRLTGRVQPHDIASALLNRIK